MSFLGLIAVMSIGIIIFGVDPHIPMFIGVIIAALISLRLGYKWEAIEEMMVTGISRAMQAILILTIVGMMVGVWLLSGTIPTMIYYGLKLLSPSVFLVASVLICSITSLATGTSWGTMGTMGLALMGIAAGLGMPIGPTAGAILSGSYFGDKLSPLSDTTNPGSRHGWNRCIYTRKVHDQSDACRLCDCSGILWHLRIYARRI